MDDLVLFSGNKRTLREVRLKLANYLKNQEHLIVKGNWQIFNASKRNLDFCGFCFNREKTYVRKRITRRMRKKYYSFKKKKNRHNAASLMSYYGWLLHSDSYILFNKYYKNNMKVIKGAL